MHAASSSRGALGPVAGASQRLAPSCSVPLVAAVEARRRAAPRSSHQTAAQRQEGEVQQQRRPERRQQQALAAASVEQFQQTGSVPGSARGNGSSAPLPPSQQQEQQQQPLVDLADALAAGDAAAAVAGAALRSQSPPRPAQAALDAAVVSAATADAGLLYPPEERKEIRSSWNSLMRWSRYFRCHARRARSSRPTPVCCKTCRRHAAHDMISALGQAVDCAAAAPHLPALGLVPSCHQVQGGKHHRAVQAGKGGGVRRRQLRHGDGRVAGSTEQGHAGTRASGGGRRRCAGGRRAGVRDRRGGAPAASAHALSHPVLCLLLQVTLLLRDPYLCKDINELHKNTRYLEVRCRAAPRCAVLCCAVPSWGYGGVRWQQQHEPARGA